MVAVAVAAVAVAATDMDKVLIFFIDLVERVSPKALVGEERGFELSNYGRNLHWDGD